MMRWLRTLLYPQPQHTVLREEDSAIRIGVRIRALMADSASVDGRTECVGDPLEKVGNPQIPYCGAGSAPWVDLEQQDIGFGLLKAAAPLL